MTFTIAVMLAAATYLIFMTSSVSAYSWLPVLLYKLIPAILIVFLLCAAGVEYTGGTLPQFRTAIPTQETVVR